MEDVTWSVSGGTADWRRRTETTFRLSFTAHPHTIVTIRRYVVQAYRQVLSAYVDRTQAGLEPGVLSRLELIKIWRPSARNIVVNSAFAAHLATTTNYHRTEEPAA